MASYAECNRHKQELRDRMRGWFFFSDGVGLACDNYTHPPELRDWYYVVLYRRRPWRKLPLEHHGIFVEHRVVGRIRAA